MEEQAVSRKKHKSSGFSRNADKSNTKEPSSQSKTDQSEQKTDGPLIPEQSDPQSVRNERPDANLTAVVAEDVKVAEHPDCVRLFERLFRSFRQQIFDCYGDRCEAVIAEAERKVRFLTPEFDLHSLNNETAIVMLDLVETIANDAPFFKKSKLREAALTLVADLYNKQYELLERHRAIEKVEQFYYRLKR